MAEGWIKLHRRFLSSSTWDNSKLCRFWIWCLLKASHSSVKTRRGYTEVELSPGQFIFGRLKAADETGLTPDEIRTCVKTLKIENAISVTSHITKQFSILTINNWDSYQGDENKNPQPFAREAPTSPQRVPTYKNDQEIILSPPPACACDGVQGEGKAKEPPSEPGSSGPGPEPPCEPGLPGPEPPCEPGLPGPEPPSDDMPDSLIRIGEAVVSPMPVHQLRLLLLDGFPADWIEKALLKTGRNEDLKGKRAVDYARRILQDWKKAGGPEEDDFPTQGNRSCSAGKRRTQQRLDQHDVADVLEARRRGRAEASGVGRSDDGFDWGA